MSTSFYRSLLSTHFMRGLLSAVTLPIRWFAAHDVFLSYNRRESFKYAVALANRLAQSPNRFSVAVDHLQSLPGAETPPRLLRHVRWSRARIVLATPAALASKEMARELAEIHQYPGPLVLVAQSGVNVADASWIADVVGVEPTFEPGGSVAFSEGHPSDAVVESVISVLTFSRRERRIALAAFTGAALTLAGVLVAAHFGERAATSQKLADTAMWKAAEAESAASAASKARAIAVEEAASATRSAQLELARATAAQRLADASRHAVDAANILELSPTRLWEATSVARRSVELAPTAAGTSILRRASSLMPALRASINSGCSEDNPILKGARGLLVIGSNERLCLVDLRGFAVVSSWTPHDDLVSLYDAPNGQVLYVGANYGSLSAPVVLLLDPTDSWREVARMNVRGQITAARFSPSGEQLAIGTEQGMFALVTRQSDGQWIQGPLSGRQSSIKGLEFDPSGKYLVVSSATALEVWTSLDAPLADRYRHTAIGEKGLPFLVNSPPLSFDSAGARLIAAFDDQIKVLSFPDLDPIEAIAQTEVDALHVTANDRLIAHTKGGIFRVWKPGLDGLFKPADDANRLRGGLPTSGRLVASSDGTHVWTFEVQNGDKAAWASLRRVSGGQELSRIGHSTYIRELLPWANGRAWISITADATIRIWDEPLDAAPTAHDDLEVLAAAVDPSAQRAAVYVTNILGLPPRRIEAWELTTQVRRRQDLPVGDTVVSTRLSGGSEPTLDVVTAKTWSELRGWPLREPTIRAQLPLQGNCRDRVVAWSGSQKGPVVSGGRRELWVWQESSWVRVAVPWLVGNCPAAIAVDERRSLAAVSSLGANARIDVVDLATGRQRFGFATPYLVRSLAIDAAARRMVVHNSNEARSRFTTGDSVVELRRMSDGQVLARVPLPGSGLFSAVCISPDGKRIAAEGAAMVHVWEFDERKAELALLTAHVVSGNARYCKFDNGARRLAIADKTGVRLITLEAQELLQDANRRLGAFTRTN